MPKNTGLMEPSPLSETELSPLLCTHTVQVPSRDYNPCQVKELCKNEVTSWLFENNYIHDAFAIDSCGQSYLHLKDKNGHEKYVKMHCNHDYCPRCGKKGSQAHVKRATRAMDRLLWAKVLGYIVFTLPKEVSLDMPDRAKLSNLSKKAWELTKRNFDAAGGMVRLHLLGEEPENLHIHLNVLFPVLSDDNKGKMPQSVLDNTCAEWTDFVNKTFGLTCEKTNIFYKFAYQEGRKIHQVNYVLRPIVTPEKFLTLSDEDRHRILSLRGWHNTRWYGKISNSGYKDYLMSMGIEIQQYGDKDIGISNKCPICGEKYTIVGIIDKKDLNISGLRAIDSNIYVDFATYAALKDKGVLCEGMV